MSMWSTKDFDLRTVGDKVHLKSPYVESWPALARSLRGEWGGAAEKVWYFPASMEPHVEHHVRRVYGYDLAAGKFLQRGGGIPGPDVKVTLSPELGTSGLQSLLGPDGSPILEASYPLVSREWMVVGDALPMLSDQGLHWQGELTLVPKRSYPLSDLLTWRSVHESFKGLEIILLPERTGTVYQMALAKGMSPKEADLAQALVRLSPAELARVVRLVAEDRVDNK